MNRTYQIKFFSTPAISNPASASSIVAFIPEGDAFNSGLRQMLKKYQLSLSKEIEKQFEGDAASVTLSIDTAKQISLGIYKVKFDTETAVDYFRNKLAGIVQSLSKVERLYVVLPAFQHVKKYFTSEEYLYQSAVEGILFGNYTYNEFKSGTKKEKPLAVIFEAEKKVFTNALFNAESIMYGVEFTRNLQNAPANLITPDVLAKRIKTEAHKAGLKFQVFNEKEIAKRKMGGLLAVGSGSNNPPRFIICSYTSRKNSRGVKPFHIVLVGKGLTFDSGGISIKPASGMGEMKADMSGAAVVAGTIIAAARMKLPVDMTIVIPAAENMPSGSAMRPGDIVTTSSGKTIEVDNTDAEGRIVLADALHYASKLHPDVVIDLATLTGACMVALGEHVAGLFTKDDTLADGLYHAGQKTADRVWRMPMWDSYKPLISSDVADVKNIGGRWGGAITAAKFLEHWTKDIQSWAHIDIAGPAFPNSSANYTKTFMTGFGVRLLIEFITTELQKK
jgi:leucyl aminopeptidase